MPSKIDRKTMAKAISAIFKVRLLVQNPRETFFWAFLQIVSDLIQEITSMIVAKFKSDNRDMPNLILFHGLFVPMEFLIGF